MWCCAGWHRVGTQSGLRWHLRYGAVVLRAVPGLGGPLTAEYEVGFVGTEGTEVRASLIDSVGVRFELARPVRGFTSYKRQRNFPGCGGRRRPAGMSGTSRGWNAIT